jgi:hypothetical protein
MKSSGKRKCVLVVIVPTTSATVVIVRTTSATVVIVCTTSATVVIVRTTSATVVYEQKTVLILATNLGIKSIMRESCKFLPWYTLPCYLTDLVLNDIVMFWKTFYEEYFKKYLLL